MVRFLICWPKCMCVYIFFFGISVFNSGNTKVNVLYFGYPLVQYLLLHYNCLVVM